MYTKRESSLAFVFLDQSRNVSLCHCYLRPLTVFWFRKSIFHKSSTFVACGPFQHCTIELPRISYASWGNTSTATEEISVTHTLKKEMWFLRCVWHVRRAGVWLLHPFDSTAIHTTNPYECYYLISHWKSDINNPNSMLIRTFVCSQRNIWLVSMSWWISHPELSAKYTATHACVTKGRFQMNICSHFSPICSLI